jgi:hypothetical protein
LSWSETGNWVLVLVVESIAKLQVTELLGNKACSKYINFVLEKNVKIIFLKKAYSQQWRLA